MLSVEAVGRECLAALLAAASALAFPCEMKSLFGGCPSHLQKMVCLGKEERDSGDTGMSNKLRFCSLSGHTVLFSVSCFHSCAAQACKHVGRRAAKGSS